MRVEFAPTHNTVKSAVNSMPATAPSESLVWLYFGTDSGSFNMSIRE